MEEKKEKLIIEGNAVYEIDLECWKRRQKENKKRNTADKSRRQGR